MSSIALRERHIDRLLSEEFETSPEFGAWFVNKVFVGQAPTNELPSCSTLIGHHREEGETDILVNIAWPSGATAILHIEDKLYALPQPDQALRYLTAVGAATSTFAASALVAPRAWILRHPHESSIYHACITLEEIAIFFKNRADRIKISAGRHSVELLKRLRWREQLLSGARQRQAVYGALHSGELTDWNQAAAEVIAAKNGLVLMVRERVRSKGRAHASRFILFVEQLSPYHNGKSPLLKLKTAEVNTPGRVSLEVPSATTDSILRSQAASSGFQIKDTAAGTLIISATTDNLKELTIAKPVADQIIHLEDAADMAQNLIEWWESRA